MGKKKGKTATKKRRKRADSWKKENVPVHTGLPPQVEGQLRCYLQVSVNQILWIIPNAPELTHVRLKWWGEDGEGALFRPIDVKRGNKGIGQTTATYAIRSGPKQFAAYVNDMGGLLLEVLSGSMMVTVGRAEVPNIGLVAPNRPINGFFPVMSADGEKIAELQVSVLLESLMASYDSMSSIPTPDMSAEVYSSGNDMQPINRPRVIPVPPSHPAFSSSEDPFASPGPKIVRNLESSRILKGIDDQLFGVRDSIQSRISTAPSSLPRHTGTDDSYTLKGGDTLESIKSIPHDEDVETVRPHSSYAESHTRNTRLSTKEYGKELRGHSRGYSGEITKATGQGPAMREHKIPAKEATSRIQTSSSSSMSKDLVSALLDRGQKLREAMIVSTLDTPPKPGSTAAADIHVPVGPPAIVRRDGPTRNLFKEILLEPAGKPSDILPDLDHTGLTEYSDLEGRTVELVLGPGVTESQLQILKTLDCSPSSSVSGDDILSDPGDPIHDEAIIQELFYKNQPSEESDVSFSDEEIYSLHRNNSVASLEEPGNRRPPSRTSSCSSLGPEREPVRDVDKSGSSKRTPTKGKKKKVPTATLR